MCTDRHRRNEMSSQHAACSRSQAVAVAVAVTTGAVGSSGWVRTHHVEPLQVEAPAGPQVGARGVWLCDLALAGARVEAVGQAPVSALRPCEDELVVQRQPHRSGRVHGAGHGLGLEPGALVLLALLEHAEIGVLLEELAVARLLLLAVVEQRLQRAIRGAEVDARVWERIVQRERRRRALGQGGAGNDGRHAADGRDRGHRDLPLRQ